jgi:hypothetical protein
VVWRGFVVATGVGLVLAFAAFVALYEVIGEPSDVLFPCLMVGVGLVFGAFQQRVIRPALGSARGWAVATGVGLGLGYGLAVALGLGESGGFVGKMAQTITAGAAGGAIIGMLQWRVLAHRVDDARWWVLASIAGWATGAALSSAASHIDEGLDILIGPVVAAAISGVVLVALIGRTKGRRASRQASSSTTTLSPR